MAFDIRIASTRQRLKPDNSEEISNLVTPGDVITADTGFMRYEQDLFFVVKATELLLGM